MCIDNSTLENLLPGVVDGTIDLVLRAQCSDNNGNYVPSNDDDYQRTGFELIYDENTKYEYSIC